MEIGDHGLLGESAALLVDIMAVEKDIENASSPLQSMAGFHV